MARALAPAIAALLAGIALATPALAQVQPPGVQPNIEERVRPEQPESPLSITPEELTLTGQNDLVLLENRQLFELHASSGLDFTDNAFLSYKHQASDTVFNNSAGARVATRIDELYDVYAGLDLATSSHAANPILDFSDFAGTVGTGFPVRNFRLDFSYTGTDVHASSFGHEFLTLHDLAGSVSYPMRYRGAAIAPQFTLTRAYAEPTQFTSTEFRLGAGISYPIRGDLGLFGQPSIYYRSYDNYFRNVTGVNRVDTGVDLPAGIVWAPRPYLSAVLQLDLAYNSSTFAPNSYTALSAMPSVRLKYGF
jgi:hypothetical protein